MYRYKIYGLVLESEIDFEEFEKADESLEGKAQSEADVYFRCGQVKNEIDEYLEEIGHPTFKIYCSTEWGCLKLDFGFMIIRSGREIVFQAEGVVDAQVISPFVSGAAFAILLVQRHIIPIHCSALSDEKKSIIISGQPGAGKSTVSRTLLERGYKFMADDIAAVKILEDKAYAYPSFPYQRLCRNEVVRRKLDVNSLRYVDEEKDKFLISVKDYYVSEPKELAAMIVLAKNDVKDVEVVKLIGFEHLIALKTNMYLSYILGYWMSDPEFEKVFLQVVSKCPIFLITRPLEGEYSEKIADIIAKLKATN